MMIPRITKGHFSYWIPVFYDSYIGKTGIYVLGYTKSGTNWLRNLIHRYYDIKLPAAYRLGEPFFGKRIFHMHRFVPSKYFLNNTIYMVRDGRDTIVSRYFTMVKQDSQSIMKEDFEKYSGIKPTADNIKDNLPAYISFLKDYHKSTIDYLSHVNKAVNDGYFIIKYEDLIKDTPGTLTKVLNFVSKNDPINTDKMNEAIDYCSFEKAKKRQKKDTGFFRKGGGKTGDWRNYFSHKSAQVYDEYAGDLLVKLGYEKDRNWINDFE